MAIFSRLCTLLLRFHVWPLSVVVAGMFIVGAWTEHTLDLLTWLQPHAQWGLRDVIGKHKTVGWYLAVTAGLMLPLKLWMSIAKPPRPALHSSLSSLLIHHHWWLLALLFPAQYLTTVYAGSVASALGVQPAQVFAWHWPIALAILAITALLVLQKLFLLPNAVWPLLRRSKPSQPQSKKE